MQSAKLNFLNCQELNGQNRPVSVAWGPWLQRGLGTHDAEVDVSIECWEITAGFMRYVYLCPFD